MILLFTIFNIEFKILKYLFLFICIHLWLIFHLCNLWLYLCVYFWCLFLLNSIDLIFNLLLIICSNAWNHRWWWHFGLDHTLEIIKLITILLLFDFFVMWGSLLFLLTLLLLFNNNILIYIIIRTKVISIPFLSIITIHLFLLIIWKLWIYIIILIHITFVKFTEIIIIW